MNTKQVQLNLIKLGFGSYLRPYGADGKVGVKTRQGVRAFQLKYNSLFKKSILVDGKIGPQVRNAIIDWLKNIGKKGSNNFSIREMRCKGTGKMYSKGMDNNLIIKLEKLRYHFKDKPVIVTSGYRSPSHNKRVGGAKNSQHLYGKAVDIKVKGISPSRVYNYAIKHFDGVGKYNTFTHVDTRGYKASW